MIRPTQPIPVIPTSSTPIRMTAAMWESIQVFTRVDDGDRRGDHLFHQRRHVPALHRGSRAFPNSPSCIRGDGHGAPDVRERIDAENAFFTRLDALDELARRFGHLIIGQLANRRHTLLNSPGPRTPPQPRRRSRTRPENYLGYLNFAFATLFGPTVLRFSVLHLEQTMALAAFMLRLSNFTGPKKVCKLMFAIASRTFFLSSVPAASIAFWATMPAAVDAAAT